MTPTLISWARKTPGVQLWFCARREMGAFAYFYGRIFGYIDEGGLAPGGRGFVSPSAKLRGMM